MSEDIKVPTLKCDDCGRDYPSDEAHVCPPEAHLYDRRFSGCAVCGKVSLQDGERRACPVNEPKAFMEQTGMDQAQFDEYMAAWHRDSKDPDWDRPKVKIKAVWSLNRGFATLYCTCGMMARIGPFVGVPRSPEYGKLLGDKIQEACEEHTKRCAALGRAKAHEIRTGSLH